ncbi:MAG: alpha-glucosidase C-terminal domain-containing protein, partial [Flavisolibacter sp.]
QPDLNFDNPAVQEEIFRIIDFWCAKGVDGFRLDAIPYLFEREGTNGENLPETHAYLKRLRKFIDEKYPGKAFLAEANMWPEDSASYFGNGDECHMNYHFPVMPRMFMALQQEDRYPITDIFDQTPDIPENCQWAIFLRNHDELTLEMVTDEERDFMYKVYAKDPKARINLGIRHRLAPLMENSRSKMELMNSLLFSLPGTPVIYYGDEIGMGDNFYLGDRDGVRTPMQWSPDRNAGFSEANPQQLYLPVILDPEYHYEAVNVEMQRRNTSSLFWFMKRMINMRRHYKAFSRGKMEFIQVDNPKILAFTRTFEDETILVISNLSKYAQPAQIDLQEFTGFLPVELFSRNPFPAVKNKTPYLFTLGPHSFQWFLLQKIHTGTNGMDQLSRISLSEWEEISQGENIFFLQEKILPGFLSKVKWFKGKKRKIYSITINIALQFSSEWKGNLWFVEVSYESGLSETYQLIVTFVSGSEARTLFTEHPEAILAQMNLGESEGYLCDAFYTSKYHAFLITGISETVLNNDASPYVFNFKNEVTLAGDNKSSLVRMHPGDENNTSLAIGNRFFLKMYRKVERTIHPDVELSEYLSEKAGFKNVPAFLGTIELKDGNDRVKLGMMQALIENHGDGHTYMTERLNNYIERIMVADRSSVNLIDKMGTITEHVSFEELPAELQNLIGARTAEEASLIGKRTAEMHLLLASEKTNRDFAPEEYSLHYQRSLFSS